MQSHPMCDCAQTTLFPSAEGRRPRLHRPRLGRLRHHRRAQPRRRHHPREAALRHQEGAQHWARGGRKEVCGWGPVGCPSQQLRLGRKEGVVSSECQHTANGRRRGLKGREINHRRVNHDWGGGGSGSPGMEDVSTANGRRRGFKDGQTRLIDVKLWRSRDSQAPG